MGLLICNDTFYQSTRVLRLLTTTSLPEIRDDRVECSLQWPNGQAPNLCYHKKLSCYNGACVAKKKKNKKIRLDWQEVRKPSHSSTQLQAIMEKHNEVFREELGSMKKITVKLHEKPDSKPVFMKTRPVPLAIRLKVEADLDDLVKNGVLGAVTTSEWATLIIPAPKKDRGIQTCGDFKVTLNPVLTVKQHPLPLIDNSFAGLSGGQKFSMIYLNQAYLQMCIEEQSLEMLSINTHKGFFRYYRPGVGN